MSQNTATTENLVQPPVSENGGTGKHVHSDFKSAFKSVPPQTKQRAYILLAVAGVTMAFLLLSRLIWLFEPLLDKIYYGTLSEIVYYIILGLLYTAYIVALNEYVKRKCNIHLFKINTEKISILRAVGIIAVCAVAVFIISASFGFKLKMEKEMGMGVTLATALTNIAVYFYYAFHLWLGLTAASLIQYAMSMLFPAKYTVPYGAIFLVAVFGVIEYLLESFTTPHLYTEYYFALTVVYGIIFTLTKRSFHISYWASVITMVL